MKKQTKVLVAATLLTLGASFSAFAAIGYKNGTWVNGEDGWQYADKEGEFVEGEWCQSNGVDFWINDEGFLGANEWVTEGDHTYYVEEDGSMSVSEWQYVYGEDDEDADEPSWFWFDAKGRMAKSKTVKYEGNTYYFGADGKMLTGWVDGKNFQPANEETKGDADTDAKVENVVFCDENGARQKGWLNEFAWDAHLEDCYEGEHEKWFWADSNGKLVKGKKDIEGYTYFFDADTREMLEGWIIYDGTTYAAAAEDASFVGAEAVYYATEDGAGYAKKNGWRELENTSGDEFWYHFDKLGRAFLGTATESNAQAINFADGEEIYAPIENDGAAFTVESKKINGVKYYFNAEGEMLDGLVEIDGNLMYLDGGAAQTGKVTLTDDNENDYTFYFAEKTVSDEGYTKYVAVDGNKDGYCYVNGLLVKSEENGVYLLATTGAGDFIVDYRGKIQHNEKKVYEGVSVGDEKFAFNEDLDGAYEDSINYNAE